MSGNQTVYIGQDVKVVVNVIDDTGSHAAATIDTGTTRVDGFAAIPTINTIGPGIYEVVFVGLTPAPVEGDRLIVKVNGAIDGDSAWTEYAIPVIIQGPVASLATQASVDNIPAKGESLRYTNVLGGTDDVTITDTP